MKHEKSYDNPILIPYDDNNMAHVLAGPDYGQVDSGSKETAWTEIDSWEYSDFVSDIRTKILLKRPGFNIA